MVQTKVDASKAIAGLDLTEQIMVQANNVAMQIAGNFVLRQVRTNMSFEGEKAPIGMLGRKTGRTVAGMYVKAFKRKNGMDGVSIRSHKDRAHVLRFNEYGTKSHGRYPKSAQGRTIREKRFLAAKLGRSKLPARKILLTTWQNISHAAGTIYANQFDAYFQMNTSKA